MACGSGCTKCLYAIVPGVSNAVLLNGELGSILVNEAIPAPGPAYGIGSNGCEGQVGRVYDDVLHLEKIFIINIVGIMYAL